jgi:hypothetical protein
MDTVVEWLNENELRAYPLIEGEASQEVPENFLLDLLLVVNRDVATLSQVRLLGITGDAVGLSVEFSGEGNTFLVSKTGTFPQYVRNSNGSLAVFGEGAKTFFAVGSSLNLVCDIPVEPATIFKFDLAWLGVSSVGTYKNYQSDNVGSYVPKTPLVLNAQNQKLTEHVEFYPGYNYKINFRDDKINMAVGFKFGLPMDCTTEFVAPELKDCHDIISYINGVPPDSRGVFRITAGENIFTFSGNTVDEDIPDNNPMIEALYYSQGKPQIERINPNTLFVGLTFLETDLCSPVQLLPTNN